MGKQPKLRFVDPKRVHFLYHYEPFSATYLFDLLSNQRIHCSVPANVNDPWDGRPTLEASLPEDDPTSIDRLAEILDDDPSELRAIIHNDPEFLGAFARSASDSIEIALETHPFYCLAPNPKSQLMWSHYGYKHQGICLEFGVDNDLFRHARKVIYKRTYPRLPLDHIDKDTLLYFLLVKSSVWRYEREYRIIGEPCLPKGTNYLVPDGDFFRLPPYSLKSVIAGCGCTSGTYYQIKTIVDKHAIPLKRARRLPNQYKLEITDELLFPTD